MTDSLFGDMNLLQGAFDFDEIEDDIMAQDLHGEVSDEDLKELAPKADIGHINKEDASEGASSSTRDAFDDYKYAYETAIPPEAIEEYRREELKKREAELAAANEKETNGLVGVINNSENDNYSEDDNEEDEEEYLSKLADSIDLEGDDEEGYEENFGEGYEESTDEDTEAEEPEEDLDFDLDSLVDSIDLDDEDGGEISIEDYEAQQEQERQEQLEREKQEKLEQERQEKLEQEKQERLEQERLAAEKLKKEQEEKTRLERLTEQERLEEQEDSQEDAPEEEIDFDHFFEDDEEGEINPEDVEGYEEYSGEVIGNDEDDFNIEDLIAVDETVENNDIESSTDSEDMDFDVESLLDSVDENKNEIVDSTTNQEIKEPEIKETDTKESLNDSTENNKGALIKTDENNEDSSLSRDSVFLKSSKEKELEEKLRASELERKLRESEYEKQLLMKELELYKLRSQLNESSKDSSKNSNGTNDSVYGTDNNVTSTETVETKHEQSGVVASDKDEKTVEKVKVVEKIVEVEKQIPKKKYYTIDDFSKMPEKKLIKFVASYMERIGMKYKPVSSKELMDKFGRENILRLDRKKLLISFKDGYTLGL